MRGIDDRDIGAVAGAQRAGVDAEIRAELARQPMHRLLHRHERPAGALGLAHAAQEAHGRVVERHVAQVRARIGEADLQRRMGRDAVEHIRAVVRDRHAPAQPLPVRDDEIEKRVRRVDAALVRDLAERFADDRRIRTADDPRVVQIARPEPQVEPLADLPAELAPVAFVLQQLVALERVGQMQRRAARAELLEDHEIDAVRIDLERHRQMLPDELAAKQRVRDAHAAELHVDGAARRRLAVGRDEQRRAQRLAHEVAATLGHEEQAVQRIGRVRRALQHAPAAAQHAVQPPVLAPRRERRRQRLRPVALAVELVPRRRHRRQADEARVERVVEQPLHPLQLGLVRPHAVVHRAPEAEHVRAQVRMAEERRDVRAERQRFEMAHVRSRRVPGLHARQHGEHLLARQRFDAAEEIGAVERVRVDGRQRARAEEDARHAVPYRFGQPRRHENLGVVMRVDVDEAGHHPFAGRVDHARAVRGERRVRYRRDAPVANAELARAGLGGRAVEP